MTRGQDRIKTGVAPQLFRGDEKSVTPQGLAGRLGVLALAFRQLTGQGPDFKNRARFWRGHSMAGQAVETGRLAQR